MTDEIYDRIRADAVEWSRDSDRLDFGEAQLAFDRIAPEGEMERVAHEEIAPAFAKFAELNAISRWWCRAFDAQQMRLPPQVCHHVGSYFPVGIAMRFSPIFGIIRVPCYDDPYCAFLYNPGAQRAFWASQLRSSGPEVVPLRLGELTRERLLERLHAFSGELREWEKAHPPKPAWGEAYPRYGQEPQTLASPQVVRRSSIPGRGSELLNGLTGAVANPLRPLACHMS